MIVVPESIGHNKRVLSCSQQSKPLEIVKFCSNDSFDKDSMLNLSMEKEEITVKNLPYKSASFVASTLVRDV